jgi:hypothetical protein
MFNNANEYWERSNKKKPKERRFEVRRRERKKESDG